MGAVGHDNETDFLALEEVFDHHLVTRRAKLAREHCLRGPDGLIVAGGDDHALAGGESTGLDDDRRPVASAHSASKVACVKLR